MQLARSGILVSPDLAIGPYRVGAAIGTGGFASVFRAWDDRLGGDVALKVLADNHSLDPEVRARFVSEGHVLRRIDSPYVIRVFDVGETDRHQPYLVLEHADRGDLEQRMSGLHRDGYQPDPDVIETVAAVIGNALAAVHAEQVVHRDLTPRNLLIRSTSAGEHTDAAPVLADDERLMLADLGFAKDLAASSGLTVAGGTTGFSAPEQAAGSVVDARADIYAASAVLVWVLTGAAPDPDGAWRTDLSAVSGTRKLAAVLDRGLSSAPSDRQPDARAWLADVREALERPGDDLDTPGRRRWPVVTAVAGLAVVAALAALAWVEPGPRRVTLDGGEVRVEVAAGDELATITGPAAVEVGTTARFVTDADGFSTWTWIGPDGRNHPNVLAIDVLTAGPGEATVTLVATFKSGETASVSHTFVVNVPDS